MKHYEPKHIAVLSDRGFYTILTVCGLIIAASAWVLWMNAGRGEQPVAVEPAAPPRLRITRRTCPILWHSRSVTTLLR